MTSLLDTLFSNSCNFSTIDHKTSYMVAFCLSHPALSTVLHYLCSSKHLYMVYLSPYYFTPGEHAPHSNCIVMLYFHRIFALFIFFLITIVASLLIVFHFYLNNTVIWLYLYFLVQNNSLPKYSCNDKINSLNVLLYIYKCMIIYTFLVRIFTMAWNNWRKRNLSKLLYYIIITFHFGNKHFSNIQLDCPSYFISNSKPNYQFSDNTHTNVKRTNFFFKTKITCKWQRTEMVTSWKTDKNMINTFLWQNVW